MSGSLSRRDFLRRSTATAGALAASDAMPQDAIAQVTQPADETRERDGSEPRRPNILFIMTDQQRFDCLAANGNPLIRTPHLDRLAARSANFSHAVVQAPVCVPSRACFFTGRYAHSHRNRVNYTPLDRAEVLMQARLREAGYRTASVGKLHLHPPTSDEARRTGFDAVELHDGASSRDAWSDYVKWRDERDPRKGIHYRRLAASVKELAGGLPPGANPYRAAIDERYTDTTWTGVRTRHHIAELAKRPEPFFLFSSFWKPHSPFDVPEPFDAMYNDVDLPLPRKYSLEEIQNLPAPLAKLILRGNKPPYDMDRTQLEWAYRSYYGAVTHIDREVGLILDALEATGQADDTIVVFTSDHGDQLLEHGLMGKNVFFEASIRVPLLICFPGRVKPGRYDSLVESIDLLPTLFELAGLREPYPCQGRSLAALIDGGGRPYVERDAVFSENVIPEIITGGSLDFAFEKGRGVKGIRHPDAKMVRTRRWKYNYYPEGFAELYDLDNDPREDRNLATDAGRRGVVDEMRGRILDWMITADETDQIAPRWLT